MPGRCYDKVGSSATNGIYIVIYMRIQHDDDA